MTAEQPPDRDQKDKKTPSRGAKGSPSPTSQPATKTTGKAQSKRGGGRSPASRATKSKGAAPQSARRSAAGARRAVEKASPAAPEETPRAEPRPLPRLLARFRHEIVPALIKEFTYTSPMQAPRLSKIVLNIGLGEALENPKAIESATRDLSLISGQRPVTTRARKSIAEFKVREGMALGLSVTLHGRRMYEFFDRLISSALPRIRDFRGISREAFDGRGNYSIGIREQIIFPEIDYNSIDRIRGLQVVIVTTALTDREGLRLLEMFGVPFARPQVDSTAA